MVSAATSSVLVPSFVSAAESFAPSVESDTESAATSSAISALVSRVLSGAVKESIIEESVRLDAPSDVPEGEEHAAAPNKQRHIELRRLREFNMSQTYRERFVCGKASVRSPRDGVVFEGFQFRASRATQTWA